MSHTRYNPAAARHVRKPAATSRRSATANGRPSGGRPVGRRPLIAGRLAVDRQATSPLRYPAGLALIAAGAILLCAVSLNTRYLDLNIVGLILLVTGLAGLRVPQRAWRWARTHSDQLRSALEQATAVPEPEAQRVPLDSLLRPASQDPATGQAWPPGNADGLPGDDYW